MADKRLIEAFPLKQISLDSVHEKNVRHGHMSTLHIWPARRPLAASRAALLANPGDRDARRKLLERMAGRVVESPSASGERMKEVTRGGLFHCGREDNREFARFRAEIREAFEGRALRALDPLAGDGAIPLEAMRLGCEAVAAGINPVAWFILHCTLHYPRLLAGETRPLPAFALDDRGFVEELLKAPGVRDELARYGHGDREAVQVTSLWIGLGFASGGRGLRVASAGLGTTGAGRGEAGRGAEVQDVSSPQKARAAGLPDWPGFDLLSRHPNGEVRSIKVKGRAGRAAVRMELNEWKQACNLGERYWLYVVFGCATPAPQLYRVQDPFRNLLASEHAAATFTLTAGSTVWAAEPEPPSCRRAL